VIRVSGAIEDPSTRTPNQVYVITSKTLNGRPCYIDYDNNYGMWYDGGTNWMIGNYANIDEGRARYGFMMNDENTMCPNHATSWQQTRRNGQWVNVNAHLDCIGKF